MTSQASAQPSATSAAIELLNASVFFQMKTHRVDALRSASFVVRRGERVALMGKSGSGKTTALYCIAGLVVPNQGTTRVLGTELTSLSSRERAQFRAANVGLVFQGFLLISALTAEQNVAVPLRLAGWPKHSAIERARSLLEAVGLAERRRHRPRELSGGEQQRVAIARAVASSPAIILADEPTGNLDTETAEPVLELLRTEGGGATVVVATHDHDVAASTDRIVRIDSGRLVE